MFPDNILEGDWRWTPLVYAVYLGHKKIVQILLQFATSKNISVGGTLPTFVYTNLGVLLSRRDRAEMKTPLDHVQKAEVAEMLLRAGAPLDMCTKKKQIEWKPVLEKIRAEKQAQHNTL
jgi:hypothetical protein